MTTEWTSGTKLLSQLVIDADKDWGGYGIYNIKEVCSGMQVGNIYYFGVGGILIKLVQTDIGDELTSQGPGNPIKFAPPP